MIQSLVFLLMAAGAVMVLAGIVVDRVSVATAGVVVAAVALGLAFTMVPSP